MESMSSTHDFIQSVSRWTSLTEIQLLYVAVLFVVVCVLSILWFSRRKSKALTKQLEKLQKALIASNSTTIGMGQKLIHLEKQLQEDRRKKELSNGSSKEGRGYLKSSDLENSPQNNHPVDTTEKAAINFSNSFTQAMATSDQKFKANNSPKNESMNKLSLVKNDSLEKNSLDLRQGENKSADKKIDGIPSDEAYEKSRQLLSQGVDISEIVKQSGLSYSEVSLMQKLAR